MLVDAFSVPAFVPGTQIQQLLKLHNAECTRFQAGDCGTAATCERIRTWEKDGGFSYRPNENCRNCVLGRLRLQRRTQAMFSFRLSAMRVVRLAARASDQLAVLACERRDETAD